MRTVRTVRTVRAVRAVRRVPSHILTVTMATRKENNPFLGGLVTRVRSRCNYRHSSRSYSHCAEKRQHLFCVHFSSFLPNITYFIISRCERSRVARFDRREGMVHPRSALAYRTTGMGLAHSQIGRSTQYLERNEFHRRTCKPPSPASARSSA